MKRNLSREAHTWYTLISPEYMDRAFARLSKAYATFSSRAKAHALAGAYAPTGYWGEQMEHLLQTYDHARAMMVSGDYSGMIGWAGTLGDIPRGLQEGLTHWLAPDEDAFFEELDAAYSVCSGFRQAVQGSQFYADGRYFSNQGEWRAEVPTDMSIGGWSIYYFEENAFRLSPIQIPEYVPDTSIACKTGEMAPWTGVWVPSYGVRSAALAFARKDMQIMQPAYEVTFLDPEDNSKDYELVECTWHPVRPTGRMIPWPEGCGPLEQDESIPPEQRRCSAGDFCPKAGYWFSPAKADSRRMFREGDVMPELGSTWGATIWQWDSQQG